MLDMRLASFFSHKKPCFIIAPTKCDNFINLIGGVGYKDVSELQYTHQNVGE